MTTSPLGPRSPAAAGPSQADPDASANTRSDAGLALGDEGPEPVPSDLPVWLRISLILLGVVLLAVGIAGLVLPGLQGILTILLALALLSLVSHHAHRFLTWCLKPWPSLQQRVEAHRSKMFAWINRKLGGARASAVGAEEAAAAEGPDPHDREPHLSLECHRIGQPADDAADPGLTDETLTLERRSLAHGSVA